MKPIKEERYFTNSRGLRVFSRVWNPSDRSPSAFSVIVHGLGEHSLRYEELAGFLCSRGFRVGCLDFYGFGKSEGRRGDVINLQDYLEDIKSFQRSMSWGEGTGNLCSMIVGHSFGGLVALALLEQYPQDYSHAVIFSPALSPGENVPSTLLLLSRVCAAVCPAVSFNNRIHVEQISSDTNVQKEYREDPLVHGKITPRFFQQMLELSEGVKKNGSLLHSLLNILFFHGADDCITSPEDTKAFYDAVESEKKTFILMPNMRHDTLHESGKTETYRRLSEWLSMNR
jgi:alpha-beta hydrolase superfamily lysophospholipase